MTNGNSKTRPRLGTPEYRLYRKLGGGKTISAEVWKSRYLAASWVAVLWVHGEMRTNLFATHAAAVEWATQQIATITWALQEINVESVSYD